MFELWYYEKLDLLRHLSKVQSWLWSVWWLKILKFSVRVKIWRKKKLASKVFIFVIYPGIQNYVSFSRKTIPRNFLSKMACESASNLIWSCLLICLKMRWNMIHLQADIMFVVVIWSLMIMFQVHVITLKRPIFSLNLSQLWMTHILIVLRNTISEKITPLFWNWSQVRSNLSM